MADLEHPTAYRCATTYNLAKDVTIFLGLVVAGRLDPAFLEAKHQELVSLWPVLGGTQVTTRTPYSFTTGATVDFKARDFSAKTAQEFLPYDHTLPRYSDPSSSLSIRSSRNNESGDDCFHFDSMRALNLLPTNVFTLRVTLLSDATLLGFRVPHHFADGEGAFTAAKFLTKLCLGEKIPPCVLPPDADVLGGHKMSEFISIPDDEKNTPATLPPRVHPSENFAIGALPMAKYLAVSLLNGTTNALKTLVSGASSAETKFIHLPGALVGKWVQECATELGLGTGITKNDVILAWVLKVIYKHTPPGTESPVNCMYAMSYHRFLTPPHNTTDFIHNSIYNMRVHFPSVSDLQTRSLPEIALEIRKYINQNMDPRAVQESLKFWEDNAANTIAPLPGTREEFSPFLTSWARFEYQKLRFWKEEGDEEKGKVLFTQHTTALPLGVVIKNTKTTLKDGHGGYWIRACLYPSGWKAVEEAVDHVHVS